MKIRSGQQSDIKWLQENDIHVNAEWIRRCLLYDEYLIAEEKDSIKGFLRHSLFWGKIPYMDMIWVLPDSQRSGVGTALFNAWEREMRQKNPKILMTSSMLDEKEPQAWHKRNGFRESGQLSFGQLDPTPELFFVKDLV